MKKDKYDFILDLIENKKLAPSQKERVLKLSVQEMKKEGKLIDERLEKIEEVLKLEKATFNKAERTADLEQKKLHAKNEFEKQLNNLPVIKQLAHELNNHDVFEKANSAISYFKNALQITETFENRELKETATNNINNIIDTIENLYHEYNQKIAGVEDYPVKPTTDHSSKDEKDAFEGIGLSKVIGRTYGAYKTRGGAIS